MTGKRSKQLLSLLLITAGLITGCGEKPIAYFPYGDNRTISGTYEARIPGEESGLMSDGICVLTSKGINLLTDTPSFNAKAVLVSSGEDAIVSKNVFKKLYPASITKLMTAYVAFEYEADLDRKVILTPESVKISEPYAKKMGLSGGEEVTVRQLINASLVFSANDAAKALAVIVAGSEEEFAKLMNEEAKKLGAVQTNFVNSSGLHDKAHYSTLYDLYLIFNKLLENPEFEKIVNQGSYEMKYKDASGAEVTKTLSSTNQYLAGLQNVPTGYTVIGGKTGTTDEAGSCILMSFTSSSGQKYISGILNASDQLNLYAQLSTIFENLPHNLSK